MHVIFSNTCSGTKCKQMCQQLASNCLVPLAYDVCQGIASAALCATRLVYGCRVVPGMASASDRWPRGTLVASRQPPCLVQACVAFPVASSVLLFCVGCPAHGRAGSVNSAECHKGFSAEQHDACACAVTTQRCPRQKVMLLCAPARDIEPQRRPR